MKIKEKLYELKAHESDVTCVRIGRNTGGVLATGGEDKKINIYTIGDTRKTVSLVGHDAAISSVSFDTSEEYIIGGSAIGSVKLWDIEHAKVGRSFSGHKAKVTSVQFHPMKGYYVISGSVDTSVKLWDIRRKACIHIMRGHAKGITSSCFSPDGKWIATGSEDGEIKLWDLRRGNLLHSFTEHLGAITDIEFHPKECLLATSSTDKSVRLWDVDTFEQVERFTPEKSQVKSISFTPEGDCLLSAMPEGMRVWSWEPEHCHDSVSIGWKKIQDMTICFSEKKVFACSFNRSLVGVWQVKLKKLKPFKKEEDLEDEKKARRKSVTIPLLLKDDTSEDQSTRRSGFSDRKSEYTSSASHRHLTPKTPVKSINSNTYTNNDDLKNRCLTERVHTRPGKVFSSSGSVSARHFKNNVEDVQIYVKEDVYAQNKIIEENKIISSSSNNNNNNNSCWPEREEEEETMRMSYRKDDKINQRLSGEAMDPPRSASMLEKRDTAFTDTEQLVMQQRQQQQLQNPFDSHRQKQALHYMSSPYQSPRQYKYGSVTSRVKLDSYEADLYNPDTGVRNLKKENKKISAASASGLFTHRKIDVESFLPKRINSEFVNTGETDINCIQDIMADRDNMREILRSRLSNLTIIKSFLKKKDIKGAFKHAKRCGDVSTSVDFFNAIKTKVGIWTLDIIPYVCPLILDMLESDHERYWKTSLDILSILLKNFGQLIHDTTTVVTTRNTRRLGVDLSFDERLEKCNHAKGCLEDIDKRFEFLCKKTGVLGMQAREIKGLLSDL